MIFRLFTILLALSLAGCAPAPPRPSMTGFKPISLEKGRDLLSIHAPVFLIKDPDKEHNLIGTVRAEISDSLEEKIFVDTSKPAIYTEIRTFTTERGTYKNLIYRIHFQEIPSSISPFYLGAGKNVGLIVIITLNSLDQPLLLTTVHTCGCYLAFIPFSFLDPEQFPGNWNIQEQKVYGENLPGLLPYPKTTGKTIVNPNGLKPLIFLAADTHRVQDVRVAPLESLAPQTIILADRKTLGSLEHLPTEKGGTTSFYETSGSRQGYVKSSQKIRERLFISWWALDWRVGEDKKLGQNKNDGTTFYTSLKPWAREESDLRDFKSFLRYWQWGL